MLRRQSLRISTKGSCTSKFSSQQPPKSLKVLFQSHKQFQSQTPRASSVVAPPASSSTSPISQSSQQNNDNSSTKSVTFSNTFLDRFGCNGSTSVDNYNRYKIVIPAVTTHLCLGGIYSWSMFNGPLTHELGVVTSVAGDWSFSSVVPVFSTIILCHGISGALFGKWTDRVGPRISLLTGGLCYGGGVMLSSLGVFLHNLPLIYLGFGIFGGIGHGMCYVSTISTLIKWFPDRPGLATGMALMGLGGGSIAVTPLIDKLLSINFKLPTFVTTNDDIHQITDKLNMVSNEHGQHFIDASHYLSDTVAVANANKLSNTSSNNLTEIVQITKQEFFQSGFNETITNKIIDNGWYLVDNIGNTGVSPTLLTLGLGYFTIITLSSNFLKLPHPNIVAKYQPVTTTGTGITNNPNNNNNKQERISLTMEDAIKTPQFWLLWLTLFSCSTAGMGIISTAKTMMTEVFGQSYPHIVTASFASTYVMAISASNLIGRFGWGNMSDKIGRFNTFSIFGIIGCGLYASIPMYIHNLDATAMGLLPLYAFYGSSLMLFSFFGGGFACTPAYIADKFGPKNVGAIQGKMMLATAASGMLGPLIVTKLRQNSLNNSIYDISEKIWNIDNGQTFNDLIGVSHIASSSSSTKNDSINNVNNVATSSSNSIDNIEMFNLERINDLIGNNTLTIPKLLHIVEKIENETSIKFENIVDPTPYLYDSTMYAMSGVMATCALANYAIRRCKPTIAQQN